MGILLVIVFTAIVLLIVIYNAFHTTDDDDDIGISKGNYRIKMITQKDGRIRYIPEENSGYGWRSLCSDWQRYYSKEKAVDRIKRHAATIKNLRASEPIKTDYEYL